MVPRVAGQKELLISDMVEQGMRQVREQKQHKEKVKTLLENGRMDEMLLEVQTHRRTTEEREQELLEKKREAREERLQAAVDLAAAGATGHSCLSTLGRWCQPITNLWSEHHLPHNDGIGEEHRAHQYRYENVRQWTLEDVEGRPSGKVWVTVELLHKSIADAQPAGTGREMPNCNPILEEPERETISITNRKCTCNPPGVCGSWTASDRLYVTAALATLSLFVGPARLRRARMIVVLVLLLALAWSVVSHSIGAIVESFISKDLTSILWSSCGDGTLTAVEMYKHYCTHYAKDGFVFSPMAGEWLNCLGPTGDGVVSDDVDATGIPCSPAGLDSDGTTTRFSFNGSQPSNQEYTTGTLDQTCTSGGKHFTNAYSWDESGGCEWWSAARLKGDCTNLACNGCLRVGEPVCPSGSGWISRIVWRVVIPCVLLSLSPPASSTRLSSRLSSHVCCVGSQRHCASLSSSSALGLHCRAGTARPVFHGGVRARQPLLRDGRCAVPAPPWFGEEDTEGVAAAAALPVRVVARVQKTVTRFVLSLTIIQAPVAAIVLGLAVRTAGWRPGPRMRGSASGCTVPGGISEVGAALGRPSSSTAAQQFAGSVGQSRPVHTCTCIILQSAPDPGRPRIGTTIQDRSTWPARPMDRQCSCGARAVSPATRPTAAAVI